MIAAYTGTALAINQALAACAPGSQVELGAGTFTLSSGISFVDLNDVTLAGAGPSSTIIISNNTSGVGGCGAVAICLGATYVNYSLNPQGTANWTAGYSIGTTTITLSDVDDLEVGSIIILDQINDPTTDNGSYWNGGGTENTVAGNSIWGAKSCRADGCAPNAARPSRSQMFVTTVASCDGSSAVGHDCISTSVTLRDPLLHPNWGGSHCQGGACSPGAWWPLSNRPATTRAVGLKDFTIRMNAATTEGVLFYNCVDCYSDNVNYLGIPPATMQSIVKFTQSTHFTFRRSYIYGQGGSTGNYGLTLYGATNGLIENNIGECNGMPVIDNSVGNVFAYNYFDRACYVGQNWMQATGGYHHSAGQAFNLFEGNEVTGLKLDNIHGPANFITVFRSRMRGWENGKYNQTRPVNNYSQSRHTNIIGNVLGQPNYHTDYEVAAGDLLTDCDKTMYYLGFGGNCTNSDGVVEPPNDTLVKATMMRWGNCDVVTGPTSCRFVSSEVPSGLSAYANPVPSGVGLPNSLYLSGRPSFFVTPSLGTVPWPAIGPDVTGGEEAGVGGHAYYIPARLCYNSASIDGTFATTKTVTAATRASDLNTTYLVTLTIGAHSFIVGDAINVSGMMPLAYNGDFLIYSVTATQVTYGLLTDPGAATVPGSVKSPNIRVIDRNVC